MKSYFPTYEVNAKRRFTDSEGEGFTVFEMRTLIRKADLQGQMFVYGFVEEYEIFDKYNNSMVIKALGDIFINMAYVEYLKPQNAQIVDSDQTSELERASKYNLQLLEKYVNKK